MNGFGTADSMARLLGTLANGGVYLVSSTSNKLLIITYITVAIHSYSIHMSQKDIVLKKSAILKLIEPVYSGEDRMLRHNVTWARGLSVQQNQNVRYIHHI